MDIFGLLKRDHMRAKSLLARLAKGGSGGDEALARLREEWEVHAHVEERFLYPVLKSEGASRDVTGWALDEHERIRALLRELTSADSDPELRPVRMEALRDAVERLASGEEEVLFPEAECLIAPEEAREIAMDVEDFREELLSVLRKKP
jgi:hypothetical protein